MNEHTLEDGSVIATPNPMEDFIKNPQETPAPPFRSLAQYMAEIDREDQRVAAKKKSTKERRAKTKAKKAIKKQRRR